MSKRRRTCITATLKKAISPTASACGFLSLSAAVPITARAAETWDFKYGEIFTKKTQEQIFKWLEPSYVSGLTVLGGEPMEYVNQQELLPFLKEVKRRFPDKTIWCYTGYVFEKDILERMVPKWRYTGPLLQLIDVLVDGPFIEELKDISLLFRGSSNQRLIDVPKSLAAGETVLWEHEE